MAEAVEDEKADKGRPGVQPMRWDVQETRIRQPRKAIRELKRVADAQGITMNALITGYIDAGLQQDGRPGVHEVAPWFKDYLRRKGGAGALDCRPIDDGEDFS